MKATQFLSLFLLVLFISCNNTKKEPIETVTVTQEKKVHTSAALEAEFMDAKVGDMYNAYNRLKTALVNTDAAAANIAASDLLTVYSNMGVDETIFRNGQVIVLSEDIKVQRQAFERVTADIELLLEGAIDSGVIYKQFCPMAFNNKGAYWLSNTKEIRNPYFGDMMLKCGRVAETIK